MLNINFMTIKKVGKRRLPELENPSIVPIVSMLIYSSNNSSGIATKLNKNQSGIYIQLKKLEEKKYLLSSSSVKPYFSINWELIIKEFLSHCEKYINEKYKTNLIISTKKELYNNEILINCLKISFSHPKVLETEKITLRDLFEELIESLLYLGLRGIKDYYLLEDLKKNKDYPTFNNLILKIANSLLIKKIEPKSLLIPVIKLLNQ